MCNWTGAKSGWVFCKSIAPLVTNANVFPIEIGYFRRNSRQGRISGKSLDDDQNKPYCTIGPPPQFVSEPQRPGVVRHLKKTARFDNDKDPVVAAIPPYPPTLPSTNGLADHNKTWDWFMKGSLTDERSQRLESAGRESRFWRRDAHVRRRRHHPP